MPRAKPIKVRRLTPRGFIEVRSPNRRIGPTKLTLYSGSGLRVRAQLFDHEDLPPLNEPTKRIPLKELPGLAKHLKDTGFTPSKKTWPLAFSLALDALAPIIESVLAKYCGFQLRPQTQLKVWDTVAKAVWQGLSQGTKLDSPEYWKSTLTAAMDTLLERSGDPDAAPKIPGDWYAHDAEWTARLNKTCTGHRLTLPQRKHLEAYASWLYGWMDFALRRKSCIGQSAPMTLLEFEDEVFFPALDTALSEKKQPVFPARPDYAFERAFYYLALGRFNRLRTHWRGTKKYPGRKAPGPLQETDDLSECAEAVVQELSGIAPKKTVGIKTLIDLIKLQKSLPSDLGRREARSIAYKRLSKRTGFSVGTLKKRVCDAKRLLQKYLDKGRRNAQER